jgi:probable F420-dependent oxidoreductase
VKFGLEVFSTDRSLDPGAVGAAVERAGFDALLFPDHTHVPGARRSPYPGGGQMPAHYERIHDPLVACAFAFGATSTLQVGIGVCLVPAREPIALAKQVASLDVLSGGRLLFGVGAGWNAAEIEHHGVRAADRWAVMNERVRAMNLIWTLDEATFHGRFVSFDRVRSWPKPRQQPRPWTMVGGHAGRILERVVEYGDEWLVMPAPGAPPLADRMAQLASMAAAAGRERRIEVSVQLFGSPPPERVIERYVSQGVDRIDFGLPHTGPEEQLDAIGRLGELITRWR